MLRIFDFCLQQSLKNQSGTVSSRAQLRLHRVIITAECALAFVLVACAGLLVKSFDRLMAINPGFDASNLLIAYTYLPSTSEHLSAAQEISFSSELVNRIQAIPGVKTAAIGGTLPLDGFDRASLCIEGVPGCNGPGGPDADKYVVSEQYFAAMRIPLLRGRTFSSADSLQSMPVAIVSQTLAERYWAGENALGRKIQLNGDHIWRTIVGIAGDVRQYGLDAPATMQAYVPVTQQPRSWATLIARFSNGCGTLAESIRHAVQDVNKNAPVYGTDTMAHILADTVAKRRIAAALSGMFGGIALVLAAIGLYGVLAYSVTARLREFGVRLALGATARQVLSLVFHESGRVMLYGLTVGGVCALAGGRLIRSLLFGVTSTDPSTFLGTAALLTTIAALATYLPARRAMHVDPAITLRDE
jgi:putative ABC transport system permease protein